MKVLGLQFKGDRTYLHGTDMYEAILGETGLRGRNGRFLLSMHRVARQQVALERETRPAEPAVEFSFHPTESGEELRGWLVETKTPVAGRYRYDEDAVVAACSIDGDRISNGRPSPFRPIEIIVAMTKRLHNATQPITSGRWMFTRLDVGRFPGADDVAALAVTMTAQLGQKLTRNEITVAGRRIGDIYFSVVHA